MRNASKHLRQPAARRSASLLLMLPFALATAQAQTATDAVEPATTAMEQTGIPVGEPVAAPVIEAPAASGAAPAPVVVDVAEDTVEATSEAVTEAPAASAAPAAAEATAAAPTAEVPAEVPAPVASAEAAPVPSATAAPAVVAAPAPAPVAAPVASAEVVAPAAPPAPRPLVVPVLANENNAIERQLGARCPNDLAARLATQENLLNGACQGQMPAHLAAVIKAIPEQQLLLPRAARERQLSQKAWFKAVPGYGVRPDFMAVQGDLWVRSFEGADAATTVYLVSGPFTCVDGRYHDGEANKTVRLNTGSCREALVQQRVYRVSGGAAPQDITAEVMPAQPLLSDADKKRYSTEGATVDVELDAGKLQYGPALRWYADVDTAGKTEPRAYGAWGHVHLGFLVWNGDRFESRDTVPRGLWACDAVAPGDAACGGYADAGRDPFIVNASAVAGQGATP